MSFICEEIAKRNIPDVLALGKGERIGSKEDFEARKPYLSDMLERLEYGRIPKKPEHMNVRVDKIEKNYAAGKARLSRITLEFTNGDKSFSFPITTVIPIGKKNIPAFVFINFRPEVPDKYLPSEEIADRGYAVFSFNYQDVTGDNGSFKDAGAKFLSPGRRAKSSPGKIAMWAWAAMRVMDYIESIDEIDKKNVAVIGHSRLGKTALVAGAFDKRFKYVISNDSGCSGAAITRGKIGETKSAITSVFPFWFCPKYCEPTPIEELPFDQHFLLALSVPRHVMVGSAEEDLWADPNSEFLSLAAIGEVYSLYGKKGLVHNDSYPVPKAEYLSGDAFYQLRKGTHYLSREDWNSYMDYIDSKLNNG